MNCKNCRFVKCLKRTDKEFELCPVEAEKRDYIEKDKKKDSK